MNAQSDEVEADDESPLYDYADVLRQLQEIAPGIDLMDLAIFSASRNLHADAMLHMGEFHQRLKDEENGLTFHQRGKISARVQQQPSGTLRISWFLQEPIPAWLYEEGKPKVYSKHPPMKGNRYKKSDVLDRHSKEYERILFDEYEDRFEVLRKASEFLGKLIRTKKYFQRALEKVEKLR